MDKLKDNFLYSTAPPLAILGVPFDNVTTAETIRLIERMVASRRPHYLATANVDFLVQAMHDVELRRILFDAHLVLCDGTPLVWASKLLGNPLPERVAGSDLVPFLIKVAADKGYRPFFLGATPDSMETAVRKVQAQYPSLQIAGYYSPPFNRLLEMDHDEIRRRILEAEPDLLFVGFGCPKQEKWINMHYRSLGVPVSVGVGGTIDFLAGKLARAPKWMQATGTEWIFRLAQEPRRLLSRYARDLFFFGKGIAQQYWRMRVRSGKRSPRPPTDLPVTRDVQFSLIQMPERLDFETVHHDRQTLEQAVAPDRACVIELSKVQFIDSTGVGLLIRLQKKARSLGRELVLVNPSENIDRALQMMKLKEFFIIFPDLKSASAHLQQAGDSSGIRLKSIASSPLPALAWSGELTAANAEEIWISTMDHLSARSIVQRTLTIDLSSLHFIDSTGLSVMIRAKKFGARQGMKITFTQPQPNVLNVLRLSRLEDYLLKDNQ
jgi:N-acetylglucosaminyldiphosphoundecaprenol N-acetyl-beta-D-mannosaminyltransferase